MNFTTQYIKSSIITKAKELGFIKVGFAKYDVLENESSRLRKWLDGGKQADMNWIERGYEKRKDIRLIMPDAKSIISLAFNYYTPFEHDDSKPKISRYAWGKDYHKVLKQKLKELILHCEAFLGNAEAISPVNGIASSLRSSQFKSYVDDGPVMDKAWAVRAGIGWMGKHTNVINPEYGSWFFLSEIITNIDFEAYDEPIEDLCGSCTLCISACPTGAITDEYVVDSNKCISYQTIENHGEIPADLNLDGWIFGCDVCQDVCPFNSPKYNHVTSEENFYPSATLLSPPSKGDLGGFDTKTSPNPLLGKEGAFAAKTELESITEKQFNIIFADSPIKRTKFNGWKRNLRKLQ